MVDWHKGAKFPDYYIAALNTQVVGRQVALAVESIRVSMNIDPARIHLVGYSLGAHIAGKISNNFSHSVQ